MFTCTTLIGGDPDLTRYAYIAKKDVLVPLTNSLYVRGKLSDPSNVLVDVGTGFYIEKVSSPFCYH